MSVSMIYVQREFLRPPDESGGYRMIDGITCVRGASAPPLMIRGRGKKPPQNS